MANRFWVGGTGTWDASDTTHWSATSGGAGGQSVPGSSDDVTIDGHASGLNGGTITVNTNPSIVSLTTGAMIGTLDFDTNDNSLTLGANGWNNSGTGTRTVNFGSGTFTFNGTNAGGGYTQSTLTNLTVTPANATFVFQGNTINQRNFSVGTSTATWGTVTFNANSSGGSWVVSGPNGSTATITNLTIAAGLTIGWSAAASGIYAVTNAITLTGSSSSPIFMDGGEGTAAATIALGAAATATWTAFRGMTFTTSSMTATNSLNLGRTTLSGGGSITAPSVGVVGVIGG